MRFLLCAAATIALLAPQAALAQQHDRNQHNDAQHHGRQQPANAHQRGPRETVSRTTTQVRRRNGADVQTRTTTRVRDRNGPRANVETRTRTEVTNRRAGPAGRQARRPVGYHPAHFQRVHASVFRYPRGYRYRRWSIGAVLPRIFLSRAYYYNDWYDLGFGPPPPGYAWVRFGPDLLLVNIYTGRVRDVVYGVFY